MFFKPLQGCCSHQPPVAVESQVLPLAKHKLANVREKLDECLNSNCLVDKLAFDGTPVKFANDGGPCFQNKLLWFELFVVNPT